ncbi:hypothetical protein [Mycobacterium mantenii]|uniref:hypothetical protein n=1 Tax=Mycobacterium mantenii TaxID=560555 RepID=UPI00115121C4|nr:hypothetical protein [Mycobacterium mantenii]
MRLGMGLITAIIVMAATAGCSAQQKSMPAPTSSGTAGPSGAGSAATSSSSPPAIAPTSALPHGHRLRSPGTVYSQCGNSFSTGDDQKFDTTGEIFNPKTGRNVALPTPAVPAGQKLVRQACVVGGDEDNIRVYYVMTLSTPSSGLTPESRATSIVSFDPFSPGAPPQNVPWPADVNIERAQYLMPTYYGFMAVGDPVVGFDGKSLQPSFRSNNHWGAANFAGFYTYGAGGQPDEVFHSAKDGSVVGENNGTGMGSGLVRYPDGFIAIVGHTWPYQYGYFDFRDNQLKTPAPSGGVMWGHVLTSYGDDFIEVRDVTQNKLLFERHGDEVRGLHIKHLYFAGKYLYIDNDSDKPVIDITTSQKVSSGWNVRPVDLIDKNWMMIIKGHVTNDYSSCFGIDSDDYLSYGCYEDGTLVYAPNGEYSGPWF